MAAGETVTTATASPTAAGVRVMGGALHDASAPHGACTANLVRCARSKPPNHGRVIEVEQNLTSKWAIARYCDKTGTDPAALLEAYKEDERAAARRLGQHAHNLSVRAQFVDLPMTAIDADIKGIKTAQRELANARHYVRCIQTMTKPGARDWHEYLNV